MNLPERDLLGKPFLARDKMYPATLWTMRVFSDSSLRDSLRISLRISLYRSLNTLFRDLLNYSLHDSLRELSEDISYERYTKRTTISKRLTS